jgi:hypothetical protein
MRQLGIKGMPTRRLPEGANVGKVTSLDLVRCEFRRNGPNRLFELFHNTGRLHAPSGCSPQPDTCPFTPSSTSPPDSRPVRI